MYALMAFGAAAIMVLFIAVITAGIVVGTIAALIHLAQKVGAAQRVATISATTEHASSDSLA